MHQKHCVEVSEIYVERAVVYFVVAEGRIM